MDFLSKWIKNDRDQIETDEDIDIGLKSVSNNKILFSKYKFNSNNANATMHTWLSKNNHENSQYIGFYKFSEVENWINKLQEPDYYSNFASQGKFFVLNTNQIFSTKSPPVQIIKNDIYMPNINSAITLIDDTLQFISPPVFKDINNKEYLIPGEIDIVANNMAVYGIKCNNANDLTNMINYSVENIILINFILDKLGLPLLKDRETLQQYYTKELQKKYFNCINKNINIINKNDLLKLNNYDNKSANVIYIVDKNELNKDNEFKLKVNYYKEFYNTYIKISDKTIKCPDIFNINSEVNKDIKTNFFNSLLNIAQSLNYIGTYEKTKIILLNIAEEEAARAAVRAKAKADEEAARAVAKAEATKAAAKLEEAAAITAAEAKAASMVAKAEADRAASKAAAARGASSLPATVKVVTPPAKVSSPQTETAKVLSSQTETAKVSSPSVPVEVAKQPVSPSAKAVQLPVSPTAQQPVSPSAKTTQQPVSPSAKVGTQPASPSAKAGTPTPTPTPTSQPNDNNYRSKYLKYKTKYIERKKQIV